MEEVTIRDVINEILYLPAAFGALVLVVLLVALIACAVAKVVRLMRRDY